MKTHRLVAIDGTLYFPHGGTTDTDWRPLESEPSMLIRRYPAGDCDTVPWPLTSEFSTYAQLRYRLAVALFDERECNEWFAYEDRVELPDGELFDLDAAVVEGEQSSKPEKS